MGDANAAPAAAATVAVEVAAPPLPDRVRLTREPLSVAAAHEYVVHPAAGAVSTFAGTTRDNFDGKRVVCLEYEAYAPMAVRKMEELCERARAEFPQVVRLFVAHRVGVVPVAEASVVIAASSPHRADAISCTEFLINQLKATVPIWKKERYEDGSAWKENKEFQQTHRSK